MKKGLFEIVDNKQLNNLFNKLVIAGDTSEIKKPGQFVDIALDGFFLRRPFSVCEWDDESVTIVFKKAGKGTEYLSNLKIGSTLDVMTGLGNGFSYDESLINKKVLLVAGGTGFSPLYGLAKTMIDKNIIPEIIIGFNTKEDVVFENEFISLGCQVKITTMDGSYGLKGSALDAISTCEYIYTCGPIPMMKAIDEKFDFSTQFSLEARMGCGFGACMGCSVNTINGAKRVCKDGPVFKKGELIW